MAITVYYCAWDDVIGRLSADGAGRRVDDDPSRQTDVLRRATVEVNKYALLHYSAASLAASDTVKEVAADIAWFFTDTRRNNPASKAAKFAYDQAIAYLKDVKSGAFQIPDIAARKAGAPTLSNQRAAQYPVNRVVTVTGTSTGNPQGYNQQIDVQGEFIDYTI